MPGPDHAVPRSVLEAIPSQQTDMRIGHDRFGQKVFGGVMRRAGARYEDLE